MSCNSFSCLFLLAIVRISSSTASSAATSNMPQFCLRPSISKSTLNSSATSAVPLQTAITWAADLTWYCLIIAFIIGSTKSSAHTLDLPPTSIERSSWYKSQYTSSDSECFAVSTLWSTWYRSKMASISHFVSFASCRTSISRSTAKSSLMMISSVAPSNSSLSGIWYSMSLIWQSIWYNWFISDMWSSFLCDAFWRSISQSTLKSALTSCISSFWFTPSTSKSVWIRSRIWGDITCAVDFARITASMGPLFSVSCISSIDVEDDSSRPSTFKSKLCSILIISASFALASWFAIFLIDLSTPYSSKIAPTSSFFSSLSWATSMSTSFA